MSYNPYLGEQPPTDPYSSMSVDAQYEADEWADSESHYDAARAAQRPGRAQTKAQAIYGVWAADEDEDEEDERQAARRSRRRDEEMISDDDDEAPKEDEEAETTGRPRGLGLGASTSQRNEVKYGRRQAAAESGSLLTRTMKFVTSSSSSSTQQPPADQQPPAATQQPASLSAATASVSSASATVIDETSGPTTTLSFKRRRLAQQAEINRQKAPDPPYPTSASANPNQPTQPARPTFRPPKLDADYAAFTAHTPAVLAMMERMGFCGRLGKHETGVALPILPQVRPKGVGLGGVKEKVARVGRNAEEEERIEKEVEREKEQKRKLKEERSGTVSGRGGMGAAGAREKAWKRGERKGQTVYKTAHEVIQEHAKHPTAPATSTSNTTPAVVIDMTSGIPVQKHLSSLSASTAPTAATSSAPPSACPELVHNVQLLCDLCENTILDTEQQIERLQHDIDAMERDEARMRVRMDKDVEAERRLQAVIGMVDEAGKRLVECGGESVGVRLGVVERLYQRLRHEWTREWRMYGLVRVVVVLLLPLLKELVGKWEVLPAKAEAVSTSDELFDELKRWRELLDESTSAVYYDELISTLLQPPLRLALSSASLSLQQPAPIVSLFQRLRSVLPARLYSSVVSSLLVPRLQRLLGAYSPRTMAAPYWLLSYASVLAAEELQSLAGVVRQRLMLTIGGWKVEDDVEAVQHDEVEEVGGLRESMVDKVAEWKGVWREDEMDAFLSRYIQPRLLAAITALRSAATTTPTNSLPLVAAVLAWSPLFSPLAFTPVLSAILSHFLAVLFGVLSQREPDLELASDAYEQWKSVLSSGAAAHRALVDEVSRRALTMMNAAMEERDITATYRDATTYLRQPTHPNPPTDRPPALERPRPAALGEDRDGRSMRDVLYAFGSAHGFDVYPHGRRVVLGAGGAGAGAGGSGGQEVYWFGGVQVYWSGEEVYAMDERSKEWEMVSLSQLLQYAKQAQARGRT